MRRQIKRPRVLLTMRQEKRPRVLQKKKKALSDYCFKMVGKGGFEPPKSATTDLQSAPFGRSGIPPKEKRNSIDLIAFRQAPFFIFLK